MSSGVVPGRVRQSISIIASPGITLYFTPARMMSGLMESRRSARMARAYIGSHAVRMAASLRRGSVSSAMVATNAARSGGSSARTPSRNSRITGVRRGSPGMARRRTTSAAMTAALSSRGMEPWPQVPWTWIRKTSKPFSATWIG